MRSPGSGASGAHVVALVALMVFLVVLMSERAAPVFRFTNPSHEREYRSRIVLSRVQVAVCDAKR